MTDAERDELLQLRADVRAAAGELMMDLGDAPPGSLMARLLVANRLMSRERDALRGTVRATLPGLSDEADKCIAALWEARRERDEARERVNLLVQLCEGMLEEAFFDAWREGAADAHTTGQDEHWQWTDAFKAEARARAQLAVICGKGKTPA